ncbi:MAG: hypothetical protein JWP74_373 [Marmoricola sp.]|nr:hypothetical protein [Marmoricola sp.]
MSAPLRSVAPKIGPKVALAIGVLASVVLLAGCSSGSTSGGGGSGDGTGVGQDGATATLTTATCWTGTTAGADPQNILKVSKTFGVGYFDTAHALANRPAFARTVPCSAKHAVEVYKAVSLTDVTPHLSGYAALLRPSTRAYRAIDSAVRHACMNGLLVNAAADSGAAGASLQPAFPAGLTLGWAPPSPAQWANGQRVYACTLTQTDPSPLLYASVFTRGFPTGDRTCINSASLIYVDCARKHDRERIAVLDVTAAVRAGRLPGASAIRVGSHGRFVNLSPSTYAALDRACTAYLHGVSTTTRLTGVAETDADQWPAQDGSFEVSCEADTAAPKKPLITSGSVYDRS